MRHDDVRLARHGGKLGFAKWSNANMIVQAQIESKKAWENLDGILSVRGLTGVVGGPNDFAASLGHPGEPDHPERVDDILAVKGLTGVTGGPNDFAASLGFPAQPDHPKRVAATADVEKRARAAGKTVGTENVGTTALELLAGKARELIAARDRA